MCFPVLFSPFLTHTLEKESKQALIATVEFEGTERTNSTHTAHTHINMLSRVAAIMAPRTHNRRGVTGSSGRRREGRESEPPRPNMSRRVFASLVLPLFVVMMCGSGAATAQVGNNAVASTPSLSALTGAITAEGSASGGVEVLQRVDLFVPQKTQVLPKTGTDSGRRDSFVSPSLVSAGGVIAAFAEGQINAKNPIPNQLSCLLMLLRSTWTLRGNGPLLLKRSKRRNGVHTLCLAKRRERRVWMLCSAPQPP
ncbi:hypothetical protein ECC02_011462 [Trypanosoma cruzi]|uniref:Trans-sialidase n=1 Tax=Trypanosoma cruzi TaxID=5693 RepID=A0A7J6XNJ8_TRYCR|nr:hypothetical protein ECC02_011462 [Trypanosoma cruzi]